MAGIGFELRRILAEESFSSLLRAYGYAGLISSGPWVLSIIGVMVVGLMSLGSVYPELLIDQFLVSVTYLMAASLIFTGGLQLLFTRFVADRLFEKRDAIILPNLLGAATVTTWSAGLAGLALTAALFSGTSLVYRVLMVAGFVALCNLWLVVIFLTGMKRYKQILLAFAVGYGATVALAIGLRPFGLEGLLAGFVSGQLLLLSVLFVLVVREYPGQRLVAFDFLNRHQVFVSLAFTGLFFNAGIWADKFIFWMNPLTSDAVIGPLRSSVIYDLPIFMAYLAIIPGMAVFLVRIETDFAEHYDQFYEAVRSGDTLSRIFFLKDQMVFSVRQGVYEILKVQGATVIIVGLSAEHLLRAIGISTLYLPLFVVDLVGVSIQVLLMALLNVLYYLDERRVALALSAILLVSNVVLTLLSQWLGPVFYGYGFALAMAVTTLIGIAWLGRRMDRLEYETFMLQN